MKKVFLKFIPVFFIAIYGCNNDFEAIDKPKQQTNPEVQRRTNVEEAIYYASKEMEKYKRDNNKRTSIQVESVTPIVSPSLRKRSASPQDTLLYIINYKKKVLPLQVHKNVRMKFLLSQRTPISK